MRVVLGQQPLRDFEFAWLHRRASAVFALRPNAFAALGPGERVSSPAGGSSFSFSSCGTLSPRHATGDPEQLAAATPMASFDRASGIIELTAHPLGRGSFFYLRNDQSLFASTRIVDIAELQPLLLPNASTLADYFTLYRNHAIDLGQTFIQGIAQIPPGHAARWDGRTFKLLSYWTPRQDKDNSSLDLPDAARRVRAALEQVLLPHTQASACLVSGGLDSSAVAAVLSRLPGSTAKFFTYGHDLDSSRERDLRASLAAHLDIEIGVLPLRETGFSVDALHRANRDSNSPSGGLFSGIFADLLASASAAGFKTVLTGEGGDEVFDAPYTLMADLAHARRWKSMLRAWSFFSSYTYETRPFDLLYNHALAPLAARANWPARKPRADPFLGSVLGRSFVPALRDAHERARIDLGSALREGWFLTTYFNYRQLLDISVYEPALLGSSECDIEVVNPIGSLEVFRAANTLKLDQLAGPWQGFRSKRLLALAAADVLPYEVAYSRKTGIGNLLSRLVGRGNRVGGEHFAGEILGRVGIEVDPHWFEPTHYPTQHSLVWALLLNLCVWLQEVEKAVHERRNLPHEPQPIRNL